MIKVGMLGTATSVKGQGVGSACTELFRLLKEYGKNDFALSMNRHVRRCDVVHLHTVGPLSFLKMKMSGKPSVISIHMTPEMAHNSIRLPGPILFIFEKYLLWVYGSADHVHVVNPDLSDEMISYGYKAEQVHYIPNFVAKDWFYPQSQERKKALRKKYDLAEDDFVAFADGQMRAGKGVQDFVAVARMLPDVKFIWAGGFSFGPLADGYPDTKEMLRSLPENVRFTGIVDREEINDLLNTADLFFFPSYEELFPMSILEAASAHLPLLLRDLTEYRNILTGRYLTADSNEGFAETIQRIRDNRDLYDTMVGYSRDISKQYSEEHIYQQWKSFYRECVSKGHKS